MPYISVVRLRGLTWLELPSGWAHAAPLAFGSEDTQSSIPTGSLVNADEDLVFESNHGDYSWVLDFFRFNNANANLTLEALQREYSDLHVIERVEEVRCRSYRPNADSAIKKRD